ncbi:MAG: adenylate/guanylate cyclase domain-containing protein [Spartobacteria bacterium]
MSGGAFELLEALEVPVLVVSPEDWKIRTANRCAGIWLGAAEGKSLADLMPSADFARLLSKLSRGKEARHEQRSLAEPSFTAQYFFSRLPGGELLVEGRSGAALEEAEAMVASYSLLIEKQKREIEIEKIRVEKLLLNILPRKSIEELRQFGRTEPERFDHVSVLFLDFVGFTALAEALTPDELFSELNEIFSAFDEIITRHACERIKTIGDAYLAVCGMPESNPDHAKAIVQAALAMRAFVERRNQTANRVWSCRIGIHSGAVTAGVIGRLKYIYDIFGDGVNTASRMESRAEPMQINISAATRALIGDGFEVESRGLLEVKGKGAMEMFYVHGAPDLPLHIPEVRPASDEAGVVSIFLDSKSG